MAIEKLQYIVTADTKGFSGPMKAIGALAVTAFVAAVKITAEFEKELSKLRGVSGATEAQMAKLEKQSRALGKSTAFTAREVASAQTELAKLGFTTNEILNSTGGILDLAAGLGVTLADAATLAGSTMRQFGLDSSEITRVVDVLAKSTTESALDFGKLQESLKLIAPIANTVGVSMEETVGILETLANSGISGSIAGTSLRKSFIELNAAGIPLNEALSKVKNSSNQLAAAVQLVGKRAATAFVVLANNGYKAVTDFDGSANKLRETMEDNLIGDFEKLKSAASELAITLGQTLDPSLRSATQGFTDMLGVVNDVLAGLEDKGWREFFGITKTVARFNSETDKLKKGFRYDASTDTFRNQLDEIVAKYEALQSKFKEGVTVKINASGDSEFFLDGEQISKEKALLKVLTKKEQKAKEIADAEAIVVAELETQLQEVKKQIALGPFQNKSELDIIGLKIEKNGLEQELSGNIKTTNKLLIEQLVLEEKLALEKGKRPKVSTVNAGLKPAGTTKVGSGITTGDPGQLGRDQSLKVGEDAVKAYQAYLAKVDAGNQLLTESFSSLGSNIAQSLGATEGVFGAFAGTLIQGLLDLAAMAITDSLTTAATSTTKIAAYSAVGVAAGAAGTIEAVSSVAGAVAQPISAGVVTAASTVKVGAYNAVAIAASVAGAAEGAAATGPAAPATLPIFIAAGLAAVGAAFALIGGGSKGGGGGGGSGASRSAVTAATTTPTSIQGAGGGMELISTVRGQDLRFILQGADETYAGRN